MSIEAVRLPRVGNHPYQQKKQKAAVNKNVPVNNVTSAQKGKVIPFAPPQHKVVLPGQALIPQKVITNPVTAKEISPGTKGVMTKMANGGKVAAGVSAVFELVGCGGATTPGGGTPTTPPSQLANTFVKNMNYIGVNASQVPNNIQYDYQDGPSGAPITYHRSMTKDAGSTATQLVYNVVDTNAGSQNNGYRRFIYTLDGDNNLVWEDQILRGEGGSVLSSSTSKLVQQDGKIVNETIDGSQKYAKFFKVRAGDIEIDYTDGKVGHEVNTTIDGMIAKIMEPLKGGVLEFFDKKTKTTKFVAVNKEGTGYKVFQLAESLAKKAHGRG